MKIYEKILTHYLSCTSPIDKEGYLYKTKERTSSYQRRWFVLKANLLFYQERPADRHLLGAIVLEGCAVQRCESQEGLFVFSMVFRGSGLKSSESWVKALLTASHCYLSLLVRELGKQYEGELNAKLALLNPINEPLTGPGSMSLTQSMTYLNSCSSSFLMPGQVRREGGSHSASNVLQAPPIPTPPYGEWPQVDFDPLEDFTKLHDYYGEEVKQLRADWLRRQEEEEHLEEEHLEEDLIDLSEH
uniref:Sesquipedalian n=1 Tax=Hucho hucho TaxID=62062 RepID=A0A4W5JPA0_9TELE